MLENLSEAKQRVDKAKLDHSDTLDLSGLRLRAVPDGVAELTWLHKLDLHDNWLSDLPDSLASLTRLTYLDLEDNWLAEVPAWISTLGGVSWLDLCGNQIIRVPDWIGGLTKLTGLGLRGCDLDKVPEWIPQLGELTVLDLADNLLTEVPDSLGDLSKLNKIWLPGNQLTTLPPALSHLSRLTHINLGQNRLTEVPGWIRQFEELTFLNIGGNNLARIPEWLGSLTNLTHVNLADCRLSETPDWIRNFNSLTSLDLSGNHLTEIPEWIGSLTELTSLHLNRNRLRSLPDSLCKLTKLTDIAVGENRLKTPPEQVRKLKSLTRLRLNSNHITCTPEWLGDLVNITILGLENNNIEKVPEWIAKLPYLTSLNLSNNEIEKIPEWIGDLNTITELLLHGNKISILPESLSRLSKITRLEIDRNRLTEVPWWIGQLTDLTSLDLSRNQFHGIPDNIGNLSNLRRLDLSGCGLSTLPSWFSELTNLIQLYLTDNEFTELPSTLESLGMLRELFISANHLTTLPGWLGKQDRITGLIFHDNDFRELPDVIREFPRLRLLGFVNNKLTELPGWLGTLPQLSYLFAQRNEISQLPAEPGKLVNLTWLDLSGNRLSNLPDWLANISGIANLGLSDNSLDEIPDWIGNLTNLTTLRIGDCSLSEIPSWVGNLTELILLELSNNKLSALPSSIAKLKSLEHIFLEGNNLTIIQEEFREFTGLKSINLSNNKISSIPDWLGELTGITDVDFSGNELTKLPESIRNLDGISRLDLDANKLTSIPPSLGQLNALRTLDLTSNKLAEAPDWLLDLPELRTLRLANNPTLISPPPEIAASGTESVLAFLQARREGATRQWISKLLVVGEGGIGKTSLIKALTGAEHDPAEETTHGIRVGDLRLRHPDEAGVEMRLSTWDFGGQQIYHATHQFFMTDRSLFLLLWNARLGWEQGRLHYWLDIIKSRAPESPVLIIATHADASQRPVDLPTDDLRREYPQIAGCLVMDNETHRGLDDVRGELARRAADLPLMGTEWPTAWLHAAEAVKAHPENHITPEHMWQLMSEAGVTNADQQRYIAVAMHQLGNILYYHDDPELVQTVVLRPEWVNGYISQVLDSTEVDKAHGLLTHAEMSRLWATLDRGMRDHFLGMMDKYEISFRVDDRSAGVVSLVVERLPWNPPPYEDEWNATLTVPGASEIRVIYQFNTMPPGIPTWFIALSHRFTTQVHWRTGAVLAHPDGKRKALLRASPQRNTVELTVRGPAPEAFFSVLDDGFNRTLERYPGLEIRRQVPCPCEEGGTCTELFDYNDLQKRLQRTPPRHEIECRKSGEDVNVPQLLLGLAPSERDTTQVTIDRLTATLNGVADKVDTIAGHQEQTTGQQEYMQWTLLRLLRVLQDQQEVKCPSVFSLSPVRHRATGNRLQLRLYCEEPGAWHPLPDDAGRYEVNEPAEWLQKMKPHLSQLLTVLKHAAPLAGPVLGMTVAHVSDQIKAEIDTMTEIVSQIPEPSRLPDPLSKDAGYRDSSPMGRASNEADFRALEALLLKLDPGRQWGGLSRTITPEGLTLYLCRKHAEAYRRAVRL